MNNDASNYYQKVLSLEDKYLVYFHFFQRYL